MELNAGPMCGAYTICDLKLKFLQLDVDANGSLDFQEMLDLLRSEGPSDGPSEEELWALWNAVDLDHDRKVDFDEFVDFVFQKYPADGQLDWEGVDRVFSTITEGAGRPYMTLHEFKWLCDACDLYDRTGFGVTEAEAAFRAVKRRGSHGLGHSQFKVLVARMAKRKTIPIGTLVAWIASFRPGRANEQQQTALESCRRRSDALLE